MAVAAVPSTKLSELERRYVFDDRPRVVSYLERHRHLVPLLADAVAELDRMFAPGDTLLLQVISDDDIETEQLYAVVQTTLPSGEAYARLDRLDESWWLDAVERARGDLTIDVDPR